jgi:hypothetical protein
MCGYTLKNKEFNQDGWGVMYVCGGCEEDDVIERAFRANKLARKNQISVGKIPIKPTNAARHIEHDTAKQLRFLSMHPVQHIGLGASRECTFVRENASRECTYVRLMSNSGHYVIAPEMVASGASPTCIVTNLQPVMTLV